MRLIDADELKIWEDEYEGMDSAFLTEEDETFLAYYEVVHDAIDNAPTVDAKLVKHGMWKLENTMDCSEDKLYCSECKYVAWIGRESYKGRTPFCPNCGAKMDLKEEN